MPDKIKISTAKLHFNQQGTPVADDFDDVYFSNDDGLAETQYVFLGANRLPQRWRTHPEKLFTVAETGFGSGMNFLACWQAFDDQCHSASTHSFCQRLHFISFEKYPMTKASLVLCHQQFPSLSRYAKALVEQYPIILPGCHRLIFAGGRVTLDLWFGDVNDQLPELASPPQGLVDAWFLDGFAPSKNPQMWTPNLFHHMYRLAKSNATVATFTAAGLVRRGLSEAGFSVQKTPGYGKKRDMTVAHKPAPVTAQCKPKEICIIGGGLAACFTAWELAQRGFQIRLLCADDHLASEASGNRQGALYPLLNGEENDLTSFFCHAYGYSLARIKQLIQLSPSIRHDWCGVLHLSCNDDLAQKHQAILAAQYPEELVYGVDKQQAAQLAGIPLNHSGIYFPQAGWINPGDLCRAIAAQLAVHGHHFEFNCKVEDLHTDGKCWQLSTSRQNYQADVVVIAAGVDSTSFEVCRHLPLTAVRGQVSHVEATTASEALSTVLCHTGYLTPSHEGQHCLGATFVRNAPSKILRDDEHHTNLERLKNALPNSELVQTWWQSPLAGRVGFRATVRDHFPLAGPLPDWQQLPSAQESGQLNELPTQKNIYLLSGLSARGICSAPICAAVLASYINHEAQPVAQSLLDALHPGRFVWRRIKKNRPVFL